MTLLSSTYWGGAPFHMRHVPSGAQASPELLRAADHREISALWWTPAAGAHIAVVALHPRADFTRHYTFSGLLEAGIACLGANTRHPNNDIDTVHEEIVLDVGACVRFARERGMRHVILLGNSGGGSLSALYQSQACLPAVERIARAPSGAPTSLPHVEMLPADAMIYLAAHPGQGRILGDCIDPSVVDEGDPLAIDAALDMYDARNGFVSPPAWSAYDAAFVARFRAGQAARVARLDAIAHEHISRQRAAAPDSRERHFDALMLVYRSMANLHYVDRALDPSERPYGSLLSDRPDLMNMHHVGFGRVCTPRAWLSTWSAASSHADMARTLPLISAPTLMIHAGCDRELYPQSHCEAMARAIAAADATVVTMAGARHYFEGDLGAERAPHREELAKLIVSWIRERFG